MQNNCDPFGDPGGGGHEDWALGSTFGSAGFTFYVYACVFVYVCICVYVCIYVYVYTYVCIYLYVYLCVRIYVYMYVYMYVYESRPTGTRLIWNPHEPELAFGVVGLFFFVGGA